MSHKYNSTFEASIKSWVEYELETYDVLTCIAEQQDYQAPKPTLPFCTYRLNAPVALQSVDDIVYRTQSGVIKATHKNTRQFSIYMSFYGDPALEAMAYLQNSLQKEETRARFVTAGFSVIRSEPLIDTTTFVETGFENRASFDMICATRENWDETLYRIDEVDYEGELDSLTDQYTIED